MIDPAPAVARQARRLLEESGLLQEASEQAAVRASKRRKFLTSGDPLRLEETLRQLLRVEVEVRRVEWVGERLLRRKRHCLQ